MKTLLTVIVVLTMITSTVFGDTLTQSFSYDLNPSNETQSFTFSFNPIIGNLTFADVEIGSISSTTDGGQLTLTNDVYGPSAFFGVGSNQVETNANWEAVYGNGYQNQYFETSNPLFTVGDNVFTLSPSQAINGNVSGTVQVKYTYDPSVSIPEPKTSFLIGLGLIGMVLNHRRKGFVTI